MLITYIYTYNHRYYRHVTGIGNRSRARVYIALRVVRVIAVNTYSGTRKQEQEDVFATETWRYLQPVTKREVNIKVI